MCLESCSKINLISLCKITHGFMLKVQYYIWLQVFSLFKKINEASSLKSEPALYLKASRGRLNWLEFDCKKVYEIKILPLTLFLTLV